MFIQLLSENPRYYVATVIAIVVSICLHELAHGLMAVRRGDETPIEQGRITLNPLVHMGPVSIVVMLVSGIAWGSMPIDPTRLRGRYAEALVAAAGPLTNFAIALVSLTALGLWWRYDARPSAELSNFAANGQLMLSVFGLGNILLGLFNLLPVPPLDGAHILANLSKGYGRLMEKLSMSGGAFAMFIIVFMFAGRFIRPAANALAEAYLNFVVTK
jgi:Zn-dependent protease